jgi:hypothetical protein
MVEEEALEVQRSKNDILLLNLFGKQASGRVSAESETGGHY